MTSKFSVFVMILYIILAVGMIAKADEEAEQQALEAAEQWLDLVDTGNYAESWEEAAEYFKSAVQKMQWQQTIKAIREPLGGVQSRDATWWQYTTSLPGAPDGEYVVIQFTTVFENKSSAVETVTPMLDQDGRWRVSGYYIK